MGTECWGSQYSAVLVAAALGGETVSTPTVHKLCIVDGVGRRKVRWLRTLYVHERSGCGNGEGLVGLLSGVA